MSAVGIVISTERAKRNDLAASAMLSECSDWVPTHRSFFDGLRRKTIFVDDSIRWTANRNCLQRTGTTGRHHCSEWASMVFMSTRSGTAQIWTSGIDAAAESSSHLLSNIIRRVFPLTEPDYFSLLAMENGRSLDKFGRRRANVLDENVSLWIYHPTAE